MTDSAKQDTASGAEAEHTDAEEQAGADTHAEDDEAKPDMDEVKRKFREALDRKKQAHADGKGNGGHDPGKIHGVHGPAASRRNFRRKSG